MQLNSISPARGSNHKNKRICRGIGSGLGKTGGRGHKGHKSRSGGGVHRGFEGGQMPLHRRLPKFGFVSKHNIEKKEIRLSDLRKIKHNFIDLNILRSNNVISMKVKYVKVICSGKIDRPITIRGIQVTKGAKNAIENAGGKIEE